MNAPYYITTPIYYVNDRPHIGHAYTTLACDVTARYQRLLGRDVFFLTGTDEHGQKVEKSAEQKGQDPQSFTDYNAAFFQSLTEKMHFSHNDFIRTSENRHKKAASHFWQTLEKAGSIYEDSYKGWYSVRDEAYYTEAELVEGNAPTGAPVEWVEEPSFFFRLSDYTDKLLTFYEENPDFITPKSRYNEVISFVKGGLKDLSISRTSFSWGIPVPNNPDHVMYVWLDALTNYLTAIGYPENNEMFKHYWPANIHIVGKDILRFHAVYWPAFLMAANLPLPKKIVAHGWWTNEGQKISKSIGNVIDPLELLSEYGLDAVRYFLLREVPFGNDGNFSRTSMIDRMNGELANKIGNLSQRSLSMIFKQCDATIPPLGTHEEDQQLLQKAHEELVQSYHQSMQQQRFSEALVAIMKLADDANGYIDSMAPWNLKKTDPKRMQEVLSVIAETIRMLALALLPFIPDAASKMLDQLAVDKDSRTMAQFGKEGATLEGHTIDKPEGIFPRYEAKEDV